MTELPASTGLLDGQSAAAGFRWRSAAPWVLAALVVLVLGLALNHCLVNALIPGDIGDARFNMYILEHTFQRIATQNLPYISPKIFYPYPGAIFLSDTHLGSAAFYVLFRFLGIDEFPSFTLWVFTGYLLTFVACYYVLLQLGFRPFAAVVAAVIFSFSLPSLQQLGHAQLVYRVGVPLAFLSLLNYLRTGLLKHLFFMAAWTSLQLLFSVYTGMFLVLMLVAVAAWSLILNRRSHPLPALLRSSLLDGKSLFQDRAVQRWIPLLIAAIPVIATFVLLGAYHRWSAMYGLGRAWKEIATQLPRPQSYLIMDNLPYWRVIYDTLIGSDVPTRNEQNMFMGYGAVSLFLVGAAATVAGNVPRYQGNLAKTALLALASLFVVVTMFGGSESLYFFLTYVPGINSIRAVARIIVVLMFPVAIVIATGLEAMFQTQPRAPALAAACLFLMAVLLDIFMIQKGTFQIPESTRRTDAIVAEARRQANGIANPILFVMEGEELPYKAHLDAMFAAQQLGWPTVNGYSGNSVPGHDFRSTCQTPAHQITAYENWHKQHHAGPEIGKSEFLSRLVFVGWPRCDFGRSGPTESDASFGPPPTPSIARFVSLMPLALDKRESRLAFEILIRNKSETRIAARSFFPVKVSWRFVEAGTNPEKGKGWDPRFEIPKDIPAGGDLKLALSTDLPKKPGDYRLEVSLVAENGFWFHDEGTDILRFTQLIPVP